MLKGQTKLKSFISSCTAEDFPSSILLVGDVGCGKHTLLTEYIQPLLQKEIMDITDSICFELLMNIYLSAVPRIYLVDADLITEKQQNVLLKFLEEPPRNATIVLLTTSLSTIVQTIQNRCSQLVFEPYTDEQLLEFTSNPELIRYVRTPGRLLSSTGTTIKDIEELSEKLLLYNSKASLSNLLTVSNKFKWTDKDQGYDKDLFFEILIKTCAKLYSSKSVNSSVYKLTNEYVNRFKSKIQFDRKRMFEKYLVELKYGCS